MVTKVGTATTVASSTASITPTLPSWSAGDIVVITLAGKYSSTTQPSDPSGWTNLYWRTGGTGLSGNDSGFVFQGAWYRVMQSGDTAPTFNAGATAPNSWEGIASSFTPGASKQFPASSPITVSSAIDDTSTSSPLTGICTLNCESGDLLYAVGNVPTDASTGLTSVSHSHASVSGGTTTSGYVENAQGQDSAAGWLSKEGWTGTVSSGDHTVTFTFSATPQAGVITLLAITEEDASSGTTHTVNDTDDIGITDSAVVSKIRELNQTESVGVSDSVAIEQGKGATENLGITDSVTFNVLTWGQAGDHKWYEFFESLATVDIYRTWGDSAIQMIDGDEFPGITDTNSPVLTSGGVQRTDDVGVTESAVLTVTFSRVQTENVGITDSTVVVLIKDVQANENIGITETVALDRYKNVTDSIGITDSITIQRLLDFVDSVGLTDTFDIAKGRFQNSSDSVGITDSVVFNYLKGFADNVQITEVVSLDQSKVFSDTVGITDSFSAVLPIRQDNTDNVGITDFFTTELTEVEEEDPTLSLIDEKRDAAIAYLVASAGGVEADLRKLTIEDIAHKYWSHKAGDFNNQAKSILDHLKTNGFTGWDWLRQIT